MANNRMFIECVGCEEDDPPRYYIAKRMMDGYYPPSKPAVDMEEWFDRHKWCGGTPDHFRLVYEMAPNWDLNASPADILIGKITTSP